MNDYKPRRLMRQPVGYLPENKNPTEEHIDQALLEAFRIPSPQYVHHRVWLPHRQRPDITNKLWDYYCQLTTTAFAQPPSSGPIHNCGHAAVVMLVPEDDKTIKEAHLMRYDTYDKEHFVDGLFRGERSVNTHDEVGRWARYYANYIYSAAMVYALHLHDLGYDVGHLNCGLTSPNNFNAAMGEYLPVGPVHPVLTVFAGTKASAFRETGMRAKYNISTVANKSFLNSPWDTTQDKSNYLNNTAHGLIKYNGELLTDREYKELNYVKYTDEWKSRAKSKDLHSGGEHTY